MGKIHFICTVLTNWSTLVCAYFNCIFALFYLTHFCFEVYTHAHDTLLYVSCRLVWCHQYAGGKAPTKTVRSVPTSPVPFIPLSLSHSWMEEIRKRREKTDTILPSLTPSIYCISYSHRSADLFQSVWRLWRENRKWRHLV